MLILNGCVGNISNALPMLYLVVSHVGTCGVQNGAGCCWLMAVGVRQRLCVRCACMCAGCQLHGCVAAACVCLVTVHFMLLAAFSKWLTVALALKRIHTNIHANSQIGQKQSSSVTCEHTDGWAGRYRSNSSTALACAATISLMDGCQHSLLLWQYQTMNGASAHVIRTCSFLCTPSMYQANQY